jgi:hypothetical protein
MPKIVDKNEYFRKYRQENGEHIRNLEKVKYWRQRGLTEEEISKFGEYAGDIYKMKLIIKKLKDVAPNLITPTIDTLSREGLITQQPTTL